jgi:hypothetical protein
VPTEVQELLGWASLCGDSFSLGEITAALDKPATELSAAVADAVAGGYLVESGGEFSLRHTLIQRAFRYRYVPAIRGALHHQLARRWADVAARPERIAEQLVLSLPDSSTWLHGWINANLATLAVRAPRRAAELVRRIESAATTTPLQRQALTALLAASRPGTGVAPDQLDRYWRGQWEEALATPSAPVAALILGHRGEQDEALAHLEATAGSCGRATASPHRSLVVIAVRALLAEQRGDVVQARSILTQLLDSDVVSPGELGRWLPWLVRLAVDQEDIPLAQRVTAVCERLPDGRTSAQHCQALLGGDPISLLDVAGEHHQAGRELAHAQAMEDAAVMLAARGRPEQAADAFGTATASFTSLRARWDIRRANHRFPRRANHV